MENKKMKKNYNFWFAENTEYNANNPYSSITGTLNTAKYWGNRLLDYHNKYNTVYFMSENGRKIYSIVKDMQNKANDHVK
jgi:hypothetical protein